ncbi:hypothetical protein AgCh_023538 [Apium graveolens]
MLVGYVQNRTLKPLLGGKLDPEAAAINEKLLSKSLAKIEIFWLKGDDYTMASCQTYSAHDFVVKTAITVENTFAAAAYMANEAVTRRTYTYRRVATSVEDSAIAATKIQYVFRSFLVYAGNYPVTKYISKKSVDCVERTGEVAIIGEGSSSEETSYCNISVLAGLVDR